MDPIEIVVIGAIVLIFFVVGPKKIPELARSIGQAKKTYEDAKKE